MYGYLAHYGVKGMQWGVRNYQNADGTLTAAGKKRYYNADGSLTKRGAKEIPNANYSHRQQLRDRSIYGEKGVKRINYQLNKGNMISGARSLEAKRVERKETATRNAKRAIKVGVPLTATAITVCGTLYATNPKFRSTVNTGFSKVKSSLGKMKTQKMRNEDLFKKTGFAFNKKTGKYEFRDF